MKGGTICVYNDYGYNCSPSADIFISQYGWVCNNIHAQLQNAGTI